MAKGGGICGEFVEDSVKVFRLRSELDERRREHALKIRPPLTEQPPCSLTCAQIKSTNADEGKLGEAVLLPLRWLKIRKENKVHVAWGFPFEMCYYT